MSLIQKLQPLTPEALKRVRLIATDMDGTLTQYEKFTPVLLQTLIDLATANVPVLIVTGRSAGWVSGLVHYLPVVGAIAENGGLFYLGNKEWGNTAQLEFTSSATDYPNSPQTSTTQNLPSPNAPQLLSAVPDLIAHRQRLAQMFDRLQAEFPKICESSDNQFRITDWTFDVQGLSLEELQQMDQRCREQGWGFTYSTVQCHIKPLQQEKAIALQIVLNRYFPHLTPEQIVTVGDSPNDQSLFDHGHFPVSVGVANIRHYANQMTLLPTYITEDAEAAGFCELASYLLQQI